MKNDQLGGRPIAKRREKDLNEKEKAALTDGLFTEEGEVSTFKLALAVINIRSDAKDARRDIRIWGAVSTAAAGVAGVSQLFRLHLPGAAEAAVFLQHHIEIAKAVLAAILKG